VVAASGGVEDSVEEVGVLAAAARRGGGK
jgi:hypothetical protein